MDLKDTAELMQSEDYKERFTAEYHQLILRYKKLKKMYDNCAIYAKTKWKFYVFPIVFPR